jgi:hypothetical protein
LKQAQDRIHLEEDSSFLNATITQFVARHARAKFLVLHVAIVAILNFAHQGRSFKVLSMGNTIASIKFKYYLYGLRDFLCF